MKTAEGKSSTAASPVSATSSRLETKRAARDAQIAELYLRGCSQPEIARRLGMLSAKVKESIARSVIEWKALAIFNIGEAKAVELVRIGKMEFEAWRSFELSKRGKPILDPVTRKITGYEVTPGDATWIRLARELVQDRCEILGLHAAEKVEATITTGEKFVRRDEMMRRVTEFIAKARGEGKIPLSSGQYVEAVSDASDADDESENQNHNGNGHTQN